MKGGGRKEGREGGQKERRKKKREKGKKVGKGRGKRGRKEEGEWGKEIGRRRRRRNGRTSMRKNTVTTIVILNWSACVSPYQCVHHTSALEAFSEAGLREQLEEV